MLASPHIEDNVLAILTRWQDHVATIREILARIAKLEEPERRAALSVFLIISELRALAKTVKEEGEKMPILLDMKDHSVFGPAIRQGLEQGRQEGRQEMEDMLTLQIKTKFGTAPGSLQSSLAKLSAAELKKVGLRILEVSRVEDLFPESQ